jgi:hypothetical protein
MWRRIAEPAEESLEQNKGKEVCAKRRVLKGVYRVRYHRELVTDSGG